MNAAEQHPYQRRQSAFALFFLLLILMFALTLSLTSCRTRTEKPTRQFAPVPVQTATGETVPVLMEGDPIEHALAQAARQLFDLTDPSPQGSGAPLLPQ